MMQLKGVMEMSFWPKGPISHNINILKKKGKKKRNYNKNTQHTHKNVIQYQR